MKFLLNICSAFLSNGSIRDNIIGFSVFDAVRYAEVIDATMLKIDLESLPYGDLSNVGSNGITLSGGQRQRVSLARTLYLQSDLLIFDDIFSGLDADTEEKVFRKVFGPGGIIRRRQATAVLCTHSVRHLPMADHIIALGTEGTVIEQGTFQELMMNNKYVQNLGVQCLDSDTSSEVTAPKSTGETRSAPLRQVTAVSSIFPVVDKIRQTGDRTVYLHYFRSSKG